MMILISWQKNFSKFVLFWLLLLFCVNSLKAQQSFEVSSKKKNHRTVIRPGKTVQWVGVYKTGTIERKPYIFLLNDDDDETPLDPTDPNHPCMYPSQLSMGKCQTKLTSHGKFLYEYCADFTQNGCKPKKRFKHGALRIKAQAPKEDQTITLLTTGVVGPSVRQGTTINLNVDDDSSETESSLSVLFDKINPCNQEAASHLLTHTGPCNIDPATTLGDYYFVCTNTVCPDPIIHVESADQPLSELKLITAQLEELLKTPALNKSEEARNIITNLRKALNSYLENKQ